MRRLTLGAVAVALLVGCGGEVNPPSGPCDDAANLTCPSAPTAVTTAQVQALLTSQCADCHKPSCTTSACGQLHLDLSTATATQAAVGKASAYGTSSGLKVVEAKNLANSTLWLKVLGGNPVGCKGPAGQNVLAQMPEGKPALTDAQKDQLKSWICSGAVAQ